MTQPLPSGASVDDDSKLKLAQRMRLKEQREAQAHRVASAAARADRTDPFTYGRVFTHIMNNVGDEHDYGKYRGGASDESA